MVKSVLQNNVFTQLYITNLGISPANMFLLLGIHHSCHTGITHLYRYPIFQSISDLIHNSTNDIDEVDPKMIRMYPMHLSIVRQYHILACSERDIIDGIDNGHIQKNIIIIYYSRIRK